MKRNKQTINRKQRQDHTKNNSTGRNKKKADVKKKKTYNQQ